MRARKRAVARGGVADGAVNQHYEFAAYFSTYFFPSPSISTCSGGLA